MRRIVRVRPKTAHNARIGHERPNATRAQHVVIAMSYASMGLENAPTILLNRGSVCGEIIKIPGIQRAKAGARGRLRGYAATVGSQALIIEYLCNRSNQRERAFADRAASAKRPLGLRGTSVLSRVRFIALP